MCLFLQDVIVLKAPLHSLTSDTFFPTTRSEGLKSISIPTRYTKSDVSSVMTSSVPRCAGPHPRVISLIENTVQ